VRRVVRQTIAIHTDEGRDSDGEESSQGRYEKGGEEKISPLFFRQTKGRLAAPFLFLTRVVYGASVFSDSVHHTRDRRRAFTCP
jgi:ABC-type Na+ efflux pump permease subunit